MPTGEVVTAHCPNTGSMATLLTEGLPAWLKHHDNPKRKLAYTLTLLGVPGGGWALVDTAMPNRLVADACRAECLAELAGYSSLQRERPYGKEGKSRIDLLLDEHPERSGPCYVEIKNVTMKSATTAGRADFPDSKTLRGLKHLGELTELARQGIRAVQFFLLSRTDCGQVGLAEEIDPAYAQAMRTAISAGVEVLCYSLVIDEEEGPRLGEARPFDFS